MTIMTKYIKKIAFATGLTGILLFSACNDFDDLNTDPTKSSQNNPNAQLAYVQLLTWGDWMTVEDYNIYLAAFVQQMQGDWATTNYGGQYRKDFTKFGQTWQRIYGLNIKNLVDVMNNTVDIPHYQNARSVARILRVYNTIILTDMYGDVPYFDAGKGYSDQVITPAYDKQELIYKDFLKELKEAEAAFNSEGGTLTGDIVYNGNIDKWKRLANSLRLRVAMRLTKVEPELAKAEVINVMNSGSGIMISSLDDAVVTYSDLDDWTAGEFRRNSLAQLWRGRENIPSPYVCSTFWDYLIEKKDPRRLVMFRCYQAAENAPTDPFKRVDITDEMIEKNVTFKPSKPGQFYYRPWPGGYYSNLTKIWEARGTVPTLNNAFLKRNIPGVLMTYAETQFLLSEARARWDADLPGSGTAEQYFKNGITAAMELLKRYDLEVTSANVTQFLSDNPFPSVMEDRLKLVNEQLWILHFTNPAEAYSNWRRSGYPVLLSSKDYNTEPVIDSQTIPRRLNYPLTESSYNREAYNAALAAMGGTDNWNSRVWWDKE